jgi:hypothetical protein
VKNRRKYHRFDVSECAVLTLLAETGAASRHDVQIVNVSENGVGLLIDVPVPPGAAARILAANHTIDGIITYCREDDGVYAVGVNVDESTGQTLKLQQGACLPPYRRLGVNA